MPDDTTSTRRRVTIGLGAAAATAAFGAGPARAQAGETYSEEEIINAASRFFGVAAELVAQAVRPVFRDLGQPVGYVEGSEGSGAIGVGLRYGEGRLHFQRSGDAPKVFWQGPSIGFDTGANAAKVFTLVYGMTDPRQIYRRFPGVEGSSAAGFHGPSSILTSTDFTGVPSVRTTPSALWRAPSFEEIIAAEKAKARKKENDTSKAVQ